MKFASYNIQFGVGLDGIFDPKRIIENIKDADVIALQEVTRNWPSNGGVDLIEQITALLPDFHWVYGPACDVHRSYERIADRFVDRRAQFGNMILSRWPILANRMLLLPRVRTYDKLNLQRAASEAVIAAPGGPIRIYSVHLDHVSPSERIAQIRYLKDRAFDFVAEGGALTGAAEFGLDEVPLPEDFVIMGDFNMVPDSPEYIEMVGLEDYFYGRPARHGQVVDALARAGKLTPASYSWIDHRNHAERKHLDYCFLSPGLAPKLVDALVDVDAVGSDHFPVHVDIDW
ncbi:endonuclease/exonuclease/phosphatase family protein [Ciceribacter sp. L1K22]|uniref:endonuclease/exonuclease/phosphatase family protein n=1 Tax=Ciceribacter sp. L1K22 TaxID=2820275 RepID=UPI001ABECDB8|nr:endonuclease/exonuclease/phosphatase family protein [Ciceribacter sp. L1K22]